MDCLAMEGDFHIERIHVELPCAPHSHEFLEIAYINKGWTIHSSGESKCRLEKGDYVLIDFGEVHGYETGSVDLEIVNCLFQPAIIDLSLRGTKHFAGLLSGCVLGMGYSTAPSRTAIQKMHDDTGAIQKILNSLLEETQQNRMGCRVMIRTLITMLVIEIARKADIPAQYQPGVEVSWMMEEIRKNPDQPHHLENYAAKFHMRPEVLGKRFVQQTGERFLHYVRRRRVEMACRLLLETVLPITTVAEICGYEDDKSFRAAFRTIVGRTPADYRRAYRKT